MLRGDTVVHAVFGHPNHELAVFGLLQRLRPRILYLTDGGGPERVAQTKEGLAAIDLLDHASFLDHSEASFYQALLDRDAAFLRQVAATVADEIRDSRASEVLCDAVEFYNPVHDITVPIVRRALDQLDGAEIQLYEVPLVYQRLDDEESYEIQRPRPSHSGLEREYSLTPQEIAAKTHARDGIYTILIEQIGPMLEGIPARHFEREFVGRHAPIELTSPDDVVLRYEWRGGLLKRRGEVEDVITFGEHYLPTVGALLGNGVPLTTAAVPSRRS